MLSGTRFAVIGSPVAHSLSPALHRAGYAACGLTDLRYDAIRVEPTQFASFLAGLDEQWGGLSVTMPLKESALAAAHCVSRRAADTGACNTLVRCEHGQWQGDNTDVAGVIGALREAASPREVRAERLVIVGSGATARSALQAARDLGARAVSFMVRDRLRPQTADQAAAIGVEVRVTPWGRWSDPPDLVISTVPADAAATVAAGLPSARVGARSSVAVVLDAVYSGGRSALLERAATIGYATADGPSMLLHQAIPQFEAMTGRPAPIAAMRAALAAAGR